MEGRKNNGTRIAENWFPFKGERSTDIKASNINRCVLNRRVEPN